VCIGMHPTLPKASMLPDKRSISGLCARWPQGRALLLDRRSSRRVTGARWAGEALAADPSAGSSLTARGGKNVADSRPAASSAAPVGRLICPEAMPIWVATIAKVRVVACIRPAAAACRLPIRRT
jgi:hypothetical protein